MMPPAANDTMFVALCPACGPSRPNGVIAVTTRCGWAATMSWALGTTAPAARERPSTTTSAAASSASSGPPTSTRRLPRDR
jgi:hypothetical protein